VIIKHHKNRSRFSSARLPFPTKIVARKLKEETIDLNPAMCREMMAKSGPTP
jgi:hypothetical protein